jgi:rubredoxin
VTRWKCRKCSFIYDPRVGDPDGGIPPGTPFEQIPDSWRCPVCGVTKRDFYSLGTPQPTVMPAVRAAAARPVNPAFEIVPQGPTEAIDPPGETGWTVGSLKSSR